MTVSGGKNCKRKRFLSFYVERQYNRPWSIARTLQTHEQVQSRNTVEAQVAESPIERSKLVNIIGKTSLCTENT